MRDWNAIVGKDAEQGITDKYNLEIRNNRGNYLTDFCKQRQYVIINTCYKTTLRRYTWKSPGDKQRYQVDFVLVKHRYNN